MVYILNNPRRSHYAMVAESSSLLPEPLSGGLVEMEPALDPAGVPWTPVCTAEDDDFDDFDDDDFDDDFDKNNFEEDLDDDLDEDFDDVDEEELEEEETRRRDRRRIQAEQKETSVETRDRRGFRRIAI